MKILIVRKVKYKQILYKSEIKNRIVLGIPAFQKKKNVLTTKHVSIEERKAFA